MNWQDFVKAAVEWRQRFLALRPRLQEAGLHFRMLQPYRMLVMADRCSNNYFNPKDLEDFLEEHFPQTMEAPA